MHVASSATVSQCGDEENVTVAGQRARQAMTLYEVPPSRALPLPTAADEKGAILTTDVLLISSPFAGRPATIRLVPYDLPAVGDARRRQGRGDAVGDGEVLVQVDPPPPETEERAERPAALLHRVMPRNSPGPYSRLSYVMDEACTPFTALHATLRAAGFTRVSGRAALLHTTHSLTWAKHLLPSMVEQALTPPPASASASSSLSLRAGAPWRKVNHFPATHTLGRKDKLCALLRRAGQRWQQGSATRAAEWAALTPESWLLPLDAEACLAAVLAPVLSKSSPALFIVKPANQAGGQGIFLVRGGGADGVAALTALVGGPVSGGTRRTSSEAASNPASGSTAAAAGKCSYVVQRYMANPFLLENHKFDLRLYVVVTSYDPVRVYLYQEGLVRIASSPYTRPASNNAEAAQQQQGCLADVADLKAHLTNFTVNKSAGSEADAAALADAEAAAVHETKWSLRSLAAYMLATGFDWPSTLARIHEMLRRVFLAVTPEVRASLRTASAAAAARHRSSTGGKGGEDGKAAPRQPASSHGTPDGTSPLFEFFGVDVLLVHDDDDGHGAGRRGRVSLRPVLLEVNIMPSLSTHYSLFDQRVKANFIADALTLVGLVPPPSAKKPTASAAVTAASQSSFLAKLTDREELHVCLATEEEHQRASNFTRLLPTRDSALVYRALMEPSSESAGCDASRLDAVLSAWLAASA